MSKSRCDHNIGRGEKECEAADVFAISGMSSRRREVAANGWPSLHSRHIDAGGNGISYGT